jgi:hypothetical protein
MNALEFLTEDFLLEIGRVAALRGDLRSSLLQAGDALLATRLGDQGIVRLTIAAHDLPEVCQAIAALAEIRGVSQQIVQQFHEITQTYREDFQLAGNVANGIWTSIGGIDEPVNGLFTGMVVKNGNLEPSWNYIRLGNLQELRIRLGTALALFEPCISAIRFAASTRRHSSAGLPPIE